jgi:hypothetical protein
MVARSASTTAISTEIIHTIHTAALASRNAPVCRRVAHPSVAQRTEVRAAATEGSHFDEYGLRREMLERGTLAIYRCGSNNLVYLIVDSEDQERALASEVLPVWSRIFQMFGVRAAKVIWFAHPRPRLVPSRSESRGAPGPGDINGGYCIHGQPQTIVIYRTEDATRVLLHELLHATKSDSLLPHIGTTIPWVEAETEAWAELLHAIVLCVVRGTSTVAGAVEAVQRQLAYAVAQNKMLRARGVPAYPSSYVWRYTFGREEVWRRLGFKLPRASATTSPSLSLTYNPLPGAAASRS